MSQNTQDPGLRAATIPCPTCSCTGTDTYEDRHTGTNMDTCRTCGGNGYIAARTGETPEASYQPALSATPAHAPGKAGDREGLTIRDGAYYRNAFGAKIGPMHRIKGDCAQIWYAKGQRGDWQADGRALHAEPIENLVAEWQDAPAEPEEVEPINHATEAELHALLGLDEDETLEPDEFGEIRTCSGAWRKAEGWVFVEGEGLCVNRVAALAPSPTGNEAPRGEGAKAGNTKTGEFSWKVWGASGRQISEVALIRSGACCGYIWRIAKGGWAFGLEKKITIAEVPTLPEALNGLLSHVQALAVAPPPPVSTEPEEIIPAMGYGTTAAQQEAFRRKHFPNVSTEPDSRAGAEISDAAVAKAIDEDGGWWKSCSGCHETNEGQETGHYPYSELFRCHVGGGCIECGGLGVRWEYYSEEQYAEMEAALHPSPPTASGAAAPVGEGRPETGQGDAGAASSWGNPDCPVYPDCGCSVEGRCGEFPTTPTPAPVGEDYSDHDLKHPKAIDPAIRDEVRDLRAMVDRKDEPGTEYATLMDRTLGLGAAMRIAADGFKAWAGKPHDRKWARKIDDTPIPNDLPVNIAQAFVDAGVLTPTPAPHSVPAKEDRAREAFERWFARTSIGNGDRAAYGIGFIAGYDAALTQEGSR